MRGLSVEVKNKVLYVYFRDTLILCHSVEQPVISIGEGVGEFLMHKGNFTISDRELWKESPSTWEVKNNDLILGHGENSVKLSFTEKEKRLHIYVSCSNPSVNRFRLKLYAEQKEYVYGCGEQYSHFNLRGKKFPLWVSEQGVGRNKATAITQAADALEGAGGDYYTTYFPQATFLSSRKYFIHILDSHYMIMNFENANYHEIICWSNFELVMDQQPTYQRLMSSLTTLLGRQPGLPAWAYNGVWLGMQGGTENIQKRLLGAKNKDVAVSAIWAQDWEGIRMTSFGKQLMWDWKVDSNLYPGLMAYIKELQNDEIAFTGYINPFLAMDGELYKEAKTLNYLVLNRDGHVYQTHVTTFPVAMVDLTHPEAFKWLKGIIKENMIALGLKGWMADFGEYLPTDAVLYDGSSSESMHNRWPVLWAKLNYEAVAESGLLGSHVFFNRSGYSGMSSYTPLIWAGDQNVDFSKDDGLPSVIPAALSLGICGIGFHHSDIGGYTTFSEINLMRSKELFMRWTEQATFTPVMRTHEGNRPHENWQFDSDDETLEHFSRFTRIHRALEPYIQVLVEDYLSTGMPIIRPLFFSFNHKEAYEESYAYLFGDDLLVFPVLAHGVRKMTVNLPKEKWIHLWTGEFYEDGENNIECQLGYPPVFYRQDSLFTSLFHEIKGIK